MSYQQPGYPGAAPSPYAAPKKDNTLMWVLGILGGLLLLCCCGGLLFLGWTTYVAKETIDTYSSSYSSYSTGTAVSEGGSASISGASIASGWSISDTGNGPEPINVSVTNEDTYARTFSFYVNYLSNGTEVDDSLCTVSSLEPGASGTATCLAPYTSVDYDSLSISEW